MSNGGFPQISPTGVSYLPDGTPTAPAWQPTQASALAPPAAAGAPATGALSGNPGGSFWNQSWIGPTAAALMSGRNLRQSLAGASQAIAQTMPLEQKRQALNQWLTAKSGNDPAALAAAQTKLYQTDPELAQSVVGFQLTPHPKEFATLPDGSVAVEDPLAATPQSAVTTVGGSGDNFNWPTKTAPYPVTYPDGLVHQEIQDMHGNKKDLGAVTSPENVVAGASLSQMMAADKQMTSLENAGKTPGVGDAALSIGGSIGKKLTGSGAQEYEDATQQFVAGSNRADKNTRYTEAQLAASAKPIAQGWNDNTPLAAKQEARRQAIIARAKEANVALPPEYQNAPAARGKLQTFATPADVIAAKLPSGTHFLTPQGAEKIVP